MLKRWIPWWAVTLIIALAIGTVWLRLAIVRTTYTISQTDRAIRELQQAKEQMELKVTALRSPRRLEVLAKTKFGLAQPNSEQIVHMQGQKESEGSPSEIAAGDSDDIRIVQAGPAPASAPIEVTRAAAVATHAPAEHAPAAKKANASSQLKIASAHGARALAHRAPVPARAHSKTPSKPSKHVQHKAVPASRPSPWKLARRLIKADASGSRHGSQKK